MEEAGVDKQGAQHIGRSASAAVAHASFAQRLDARSHASRPRRGAGRSRVKAFHRGSLGTDAAFRLRWVAS